MKESSVSYDRNDTACCVVDMKRQFDGLKISRVIPSVERKGKGIGKYEMRDIRDTGEGASKAQQLFAGSLSESAPEI